MFRSGPVRIDRTFSRQDIPSVGGEAAYEFSEAGKATVEEAFEMNPTVALFDIAEYSGVRDPENDTQLTKEDIKLRGETEFYAQFIDVPEEGMTESEYQRLYRDTRKKKIRDDSFSRAPDTYTQAAKTLLLSLGVGIFDPINAASGYLPGMALRTGVLGTALARQAKVAERMLQRMDTGERVVTRAGHGAVGGGIESAVTDAVFVNPALAAKQQEEQSILTSLIMGATIGSAARVVFGGFYDVGTMGVRKEMNALRAEWKGMADDYIERRATHKRTTVELARAIRDMTTVGREESMLAGRTSTSYGDNRAIMQSALGMFMDDRQINVKDIEAIIHEKNLQAKYKPEDVERVRTDVTREIIDEEVDMEALVYLSPKRLKSQIDRSRGRISQLEKELRALKKKAGPATPRKKLYQKIEDERAKIDELKRTRETGTKRAGDARARIDAARKGEIDGEMKKKIDSEVNRRMDIINGGVKGRGNLRQSIKHAVDNPTRVKRMHAAATSNEGRRGYVAGAKEELADRGIPKEVTKETADVMQQAVDAEVNAKQLAEQEGIDYNPENIDDAIKGVDEHQKAAEIMTACMSKAA